MFDKGTLRSILARHLEEYIFRPERQPAANLERQVSLTPFLEQPEVIVVTGVRRCGKSTLVRHAARPYAQGRLLYLNFEDSRLTGFTLEDLESSFDEFQLGRTASEPALLVYDEIQLVPNWERWVSSFSDHPSIRVMITGSNSKMLSSELATNLTGRHRQIYLTPLSLSEIVIPGSDAWPTNPQLRYAPIAEAARRKLFTQLKTFGGFPCSFLSRDTSILNQYLEDILIKDIAVRHRVRNTAQLRALASVLTAQNGRLINKTKLAASAGIKDQATVTKFIGYFTQAYLFSEIRCFSNSRQQQLKDKPKLYCVDPALANAAGFHLPDGDYWILENLVLSELQRRYKNCYFWHSSKNDYEVDFIVQTNDNKLLAFQVATDLATPETVERELRALESAKLELKIDKAYIVTGEPTPPSIISAITEKATMKIEVIPFYNWALESKR